MSDEPVSDPVETPPDPADPTADLQRERDDYRDRWMRKAAEFDNYRRRIEKERREQSDEKTESLLLDVLTIVDDFDRALTVDAGDSSDAYRKGIELIYAKFQDLLRKKGVTAIDALGADFDPNIHQAVVHEVSPDHRDGEVTGELRKGYRIGERLLRPALVKVAKPS
jgi:molecular chaperone GrpE